MAANTGKGVKTPLNAKEMKVDDLPGSLKPYAHKLNETNEID